MRRFEILRPFSTSLCRREKVFLTAEDNQSAVDIVVLQGGRETASDNRVPGPFRLEGIVAAPRGLPQIKVAFDINANGIFIHGSVYKDALYTQNRPSHRGRQRWERRLISRLWPNQWH